MTKRDILSVALKFYGVFLLIRLVASIPQTVASLMAYDGKVYGLEHPEWLLWGTIVSTVVWLLLGYTLVVGSDRIARTLVPDEGTASAITMNENARGLFFVAIRVVGVVLLVTAVPDMIQTYSQLVLQRIPNEPLSDSLRDVFWRGMWASQWAVVIRAIMTILIGIGLVWGSSIAHGARNVYLQAFPGQPQEDDSSQ